MNKNTLVSLVNKLANIEITALEEMTVRELEDTLTATVEKLGVVETTDLNTGAMVESKEDMMRDFCSSERMGLIPESPLWAQLSMKREADRWTLRFDSEFYKAQNSSCYKFMKGIRARALARGHRSFFSSGSLVVIAPRKQLNTL